MNAPPEVVARFEQVEDDDESSTEAPDLDVLECNWDAVQVFRRCEMYWLSGMRTQCLGIQSTEILAVARMLDVPSTLWAALLDDVRFMGRIAASALNKLSNK